MSETIRSYSGNVHQQRLRRKRHHSRGVILLAIIIVFTAYGCWTTRDTYPVERLIPARQAYHVTVNDMLAKRAEVADSKIWAALPPSFRAQELRRALNQDLGLPDWVMNNLVPGACYMSGNDLRTFSDALFVSRMTRTGCLLERLYRRFSDTSHDWAGGLDLHFIKGTEFVYAVRGRSLVISRSRDSIVRALTLSPEEMIPADELARSRKEFSADHFWGTVALAPNDPLGGVFKSAGFVLRVDPAAAVLKVRAALRTDYEKSLTMLPADLAPRPLPTPPDGMLTLSANVGLPIRDVWTLTGQALGKADQMENLWKQWSTSSDGKTPGMAKIATQLFATAGPGFRFSWRGMDNYEILPMPDILATFDAMPEEVMETFERVPAPSPETSPWDIHLVYDKEKRLLHLPFAGGPSMEPTAGIWDNNTLLIGSNRPAAESALEKPPLTDPLPHEGNVYLAVHPHACVQAIVEAAQLLAEAQLLKNYDAQTLPVAAKPWLDQVQALDSIVALFAYENHEVTAEVKVTCSNGPTANASKPVQAEHTSEAPTPTETPKQ